MKVFIEQNCEENRKNVFDKQTGKYEKTIDFHLTYPYPYGYFVNTKASDGDELDCYIITDKKLEHSSVVECEAIGMVEYFEDGLPDHKILVVLKGGSNSVTEDVKSKLLDFDAKYFQNNTHKKTEVGNFLGKEAAEAEILKAKD